MKHWDGRPMARCSAQIAALEALGEMLDEPEVQTQVQAILDEIRLLPEAYSSRTH